MQQMFLNSVVKYKYSPLKEQTALEHGPGYGLGCLIALIILSIILIRCFGPGHWIGIHWYHGSGPGAYVNNDFYHDQCNPHPKWWRKKPEDTHIPEPTAPRPYEPEGGFVDDKLDTFIKTGMLKEAREYLAGMISISIEMKDKQAEANYRAYDKRITKASLKHGRLAHVMMSRAAMISGMNDSSLKGTPPGNAH